jgi:hypothetical protein
VQKNAVDIWNLLSGNGRFCKAIDISISAETQRAIYDIDEGGVDISKAEFYLETHGFLHRIQVANVSSLFIAMVTPLMQTGPLTNVGELKFFTDRNSKRLSVMGTKGYGWTSGTCKIYTEKYTDLAKFQNYGEVNFATSANVNSSLMTAKKTEVGDLSTLQTTSKTSLVSAVNELAARPANTVYTFKVGDIAANGYIDLNVPFVAWEPIEVHMTGKNISIIGGRWSGTAGTFQPSSYIGANWEIQCPADSTDTLRVINKTGALSNGHLCIVTYRQPVSIKE